MTLRPRPRSLTPVFAFILTMSVTAEGSRMDRETRRPVPAALKAAGRLPRKQGLLALDTPRVARERPVVPHHPVTRDGDREVVRGAGAGNRAHCVGRADPLRDFRVGDGLTDPDPLDPPPHPPLERGAADVERQIET